MFATRRSELTRLREATCFADIDDALPKFAKTSLT